LFSRKDQYICDPQFYLFSAFVSESCEVEEREKDTEFEHTWVMWLISWIILGISGLGVDERMSFLFLLGGATGTG